MRFWEDNKVLVSVVGGFLLIYLLASSISLVPNAVEISDLQASADSDYGSVKDKLFPENTIGRKTIETLMNEYTGYNNELQDRLKLLDEMVSRPFQEPMVPIVDISNFGSAVRAELDRHQQNIMLQAGNRGVAIHEQALTLIGKELPENLTETKDQGIDWLQQIRVANEFTLLLLKLSATADQNLCIKEILSLRTSSKEEIFLSSAESSKKDDLAEGFLYLYPLKAELVVSLEGVMQILDAFSQKENFFVVRDLSINSNHQKRQVEVYEEVSSKNLKGKQNIKKWNEHYYLVTLEVARLQVNLSDELKGKATASSDKKASKPKGKSKLQLRF